MRYKRLKSIFVLVLVGILLIQTPALAGSGTFYQHSSYPVSVSWASTSNSISISSMSNSWGWISGRFRITGITNNVDVYANMYNNNPTSNTPYTLSSGLVPNTGYEIFSDYIGWRINSDTDGSVWGISKTVHTDCVSTPAPTFTAIQHDRVTVNINKGSNGGSLIYKVYRGNSSTGPWTLVHTSASTSANPYTTVVSGLTADNTYYFYIEASGTTGVSANSAISSVITASDPLIANTAAAKSAAETASSESTAARLAAQNAVLITAITDERVIALDTKVEGVKSSLDMLMQYLSRPLVSIESANSATITNLDTYNFVIDYSPSENMQYAYRINKGLWSSWSNLPDASTENISISLTQGINVIEVKVRDINDIESNISKAVMWRI